MLSTMRLQEPPTSGEDGCAEVNGSSGPTIGHSLFVVVTIALVTRTSRALSAAFHHHFLSGAGTAH